MYMNNEMIDVIKQDNINLYYKIKQEVSSWEKVNCEITKTDIKFTYNIKKVFLRVEFPKSTNKITLQVHYPKEKKLDDFKGIAKPRGSVGGTVSENVQYSEDYSRFDLKSNDNIYYALYLIKQAYEYEIQKKTKLNSNFP